VNQSNFDACDADIIGTLTAIFLGRRGENRKAGLAAIDAALLASTGKVLHKVARIIARALDAGGFPPDDTTSPFMRAA
jgi:hypothetical protein